MTSELQTKIVKLQNEQREAENKGDMVQADKLQKMIEYFSNRDMTPGWRKDYA